MKRVWMRLPGSGPPLQPQIPTSSARSHHLGGKSPSSEPTHDAHLILGGLRRLKHAMFLSAFASLRSDPVSRAYYQRKRDQGKPPWARPSSPWPTAAS